MGISTISGTWLVSRIQKGIFNASKIDSFDGATFWREFGQAIFCGNEAEVSYASAQATSLRQWTRDFETLPVLWHLQGKLALMWIGQWFISSNLVKFIGIGVRACYFRTGFGGVVFGEVFPSWVTQPCSWNPRYLHCLTEMPWRLSRLFWESLRIHLSYVLKPASRQQMWSKELKPASLMLLQT